MATQLKIFVTLWGLLTCYSITLKAEEDYWQQFVRYNILVTLDPDEHILYGDETVLYRNNSPDTLRQIYFHLYPNAYKDEYSTMAREAKRSLRRFIITPESRGYIEIKTFKVMLLSEGSNSDSLQMIDFKIDDTILSARLPQPLAPNGELLIQITFIEKIRKFSGKAGYRGNQYDMAQWYPKVCVYDEQGWHTVQYHLSGEFYGEFGTYDVTIDLPYDYIIAATGVVSQGDPGWQWVRVDTSLSNDEWREKYQANKKAIQEKARLQKRRKVSFYAEKVHDFAWTASPDFVYETGQWNGIPIHVLYRASVRSRWSKTALTTAIRALQWFTSWVGPYPYPQLTITHGLLSGGMEYPMLGMCSSENESTIVHETGHMYFYGALANNETKEAWLDEGIVTFLTRWYLENRYGKWAYNREAYLKYASWLTRHSPANTYRDSYINYTLYYMTSGFNEPISKYAFEFKDHNSYSINAYTKGSLFFEMLCYVVGEDTFNEILQQYYARWRFKHVNETRFKEVCERVSGMDLDWFFKQWLHDTVTIDYALKSMRKNRQPDGLWNTVVTIERKQRGIMPVEVEVSLANGEKLVQRWDGKDKIGKVTFVTRSEPQDVIIDPRDQILDKYRLNNGKLKWELYPDYPGMNYLPRNAYLITWRPLAWYNDVDGAKLRLKFSGSYLNRYSITTLDLWYGLKSHNLDFYIAYSDPVEILYCRTWRHFVLKKIEGRWEGNLNLTLSWSKSLFQPPVHDFRLGFNFYQLTDKEYCCRRLLVNHRKLLLCEWEEGRVNKFYFHYRVNPKGFWWRGLFNFRVQLSQKLWGSEFNFSRIYGTLKLTTYPPKSILRFRLFGGFIVTDGNDPPRQELYYTPGASPLAHFEKFYLRSKGSFPAEINYHLGGDGNLRGYYNYLTPDNRFLAGEKLVAFNFEARPRANLPLIGKYLYPLIGSTKLVAFFDGGKIWLPDHGSRNLFDAGLGLRFQKYLWNTNLFLRVDFPFWVSNPRVDASGQPENKFKFRWIISFSEAF